jgi:hypothetical protein
VLFVVNLFIIQLLSSKEIERQNFSGNTLHRIAHVGQAFQPARTRRQAGKPAPQILKPLF